VNNAMKFAIATRDRDLNASLNLASLAVSSTVSAWVVDSADTTTMKQEVNVKFAHE
jgi:putative transposase